MGVSDGWGASGALIVRLVEIGIIFNPDHGLFNPPKIK